MSKNISYGYLDNNLKIHKRPDDESDEVFENKYILQYPSEVLNDKIGVCWDQVFFEKYIFDNNIHLPYKIFYIEQINKMSSTHTFLIYKQNNKIYYFENSYEKYRGICEFESEEKIINYVLNNMRMDKKDKGYKITEIKNDPPYHCSCLKFMNFCIKGELYKEGLTMKRLIKKSMMDIEVFKGTIGKLGQQGRKILKELEEYKFELEQAGRIVANDPMLTQKIVQKRKSLDQIAGQVYSIVFDIENIDITQAYEQQQMVVNNPGMGQPNDGISMDQPPMGQPGMAQQPPMGQPQPEEGGDMGGGAPIPSGGKAPTNETPESGEEETIDKEEEIPEDEEEEPEK